jgi:hypothetical protein
MRQDMLKFNANLVWENRRLEMKVTTRVERIDSWLQDPAADPN